MVCHRCLLYEIYSWIAKSPDNEWCRMKKIYAAIEQDTRLILILHIANDYSFLYVGGYKLNCLRPPKFTSHPKNRKCLTRTPKLAPLGIICVWGNLLSACYYKPIHRVKRLDYHRELSKYFHPIVSSVPHLPYSTHGSSAYTTPYISAALIEFYQFVPLTGKLFGLHTISL